MFPLFSYSFHLHATLYRSLKVIFVTPTFESNFSQLSTLNEGLEGAINTFLSMTKLYLMLQGTTQIFQRDTSQSRLYIH